MAGHGTLPNGGGGNWSYCSLQSHGEIEIKVYSVYIYAPEKDCHYTTVTSDALLQKNVGIKSELSGFSIIIGK